MARAGRRAGPTTTSEEILAAARELFAQRGYRGTTMRAVAARAGVTAALVHHFYGTRLRCSSRRRKPLDPVELVAGLVRAGPRSTLGERAVRAFAGAWREPVTGQRLGAAFRTALGSEEGSALFRSLAQDVIGPADRRPARGVTAAGDCDHVAAARPCCRP